MDFFTVPTITFGVLYSFFIFQEGGAADFLDMSNRELGLSVKLLLRRARSAEFADDLDWHSCWLVWRNHTSSLVNSSEVRIVAQKANW